MRGPCALVFDHARDHARDRARGHARALSPLRLSASAPERWCRRGFGHPPRHELRGVLGLSNHARDHARTMRGGVLVAGSWRSRARAASAREACSRARAASALGIGTLAPRSLGIAFARKAALGCQADYDLGPLWADPSICWLPPFSRSYSRRFWGPPRQASGLMPRRGPKA